MGSLRLSWLAALALVACTKTPVDEAASESAVSPVAGTAAATTATARPSATAGENGGGMSKLAAVEAEVRTKIPAGSADYAHAVGLATLYKRGDITWDELETAVLAMKLPPHKLGDGYLMIRPPPPPPGVTFDPLNLPMDWEGNWGLVAQAHLLGKLTRAQHDKLHRAAHPTCKP